MEPASEPKMQENKSILKVKEGSKTPAARSNMKVIADEKVPNVRSS
jgi:hypothetical protein